MDLAGQDLKRRFTKIGVGILIGIVALSITLIMVLLTSKVSFFSIHGPSMEPTLVDGDSIMIKQAKNIETGQLLFFKKPAKWDNYAEQDVILVKRVAAIPFDTLRFDGTSFFVNDEEIFNTEKENYECSAGEKNFEQTLSKKQVWAMGDNPNQSLDSRRIFCDGKSQESFLERREIVDYGEMIRKL